MIKDLHNEDEYFKKAYQEAEEQPSPEVWEKISTGLDNTNAVSFREKFVVWKRAACVVILLLSSVVIYQIFLTNKEQKTSNNIAKQESGIVDSNVANSKQKSSDSSIAFQQKVESSGKQNASTDNEQTVPFYKGDPFPGLYPQSRATVIHKAKKSEQQLQKNDSSRFLATQKKFGADQPVTILSQQTQERGYDTKNIINTLNNKFQALDNKRINSGLQLLNVSDAANKKDLRSSTRLSKLKAPKDFTSHFAIMPCASIDFTSYELDDDDHNPNNPPDNKTDIKGRETHQVSYSAGILAKWQFSPKISLKTGLVYSNIAIAIRPQTLYATAEDNQHIGYKFITSSGYAFVNPVFSSSPVAGDSISAAVAHHHLQYLNVPLMAGFKVSAGKKFSITPGAGLTASVLLSTKVRTEVNEDTDTETVVINKLQGLQKTYYSFTADAEFNYPLNNHIMLTAFPMFKYALNSITKNNVVKTYPYSIALGAGITYQF